MRLRFRGPVFDWKTEKPGFLRLPGFENFWIVVYPCLKGYQWLLFYKKPCKILVYRVDCSSGVMGWNCCDEL